MRVLVVEPNDEVRHSMKSALMRMGFSRILEASSLDTGRKAFFPTETNLIICNFSLPDGSAANLLHDVRKATNCEKLPFVFLVSEADAEVGQRASSLPHCAVVVADFSAIALQQAISTVLKSAVGLAADEGRRTYSLEQEQTSPIAICSDGAMTNGEETIPISCPGFETLRVVVIDQNKIHRIQIEDALRSLGFKNVKGFESGLAALKRIETGHVDFVLCEWMPESLSGLDLLRAVRANEISNSVPFVMFTSNAEKDQVLRALRLRADDYVLKPISLQMLASTFNRVLEQEATNRAAGTTYKGICLNDAEAVATAERMVKSAYSPNPDVEVPDLRILMVDEDERFRRICGSFLRRLGFRHVMETSSGASALKKLENGLVDLVFCEWSVCQVSGLEILRSVRSVGFLRSIPFIMLTDTSGKENVLDALRAGVTDYLIKPTSVETLAEAIARVITTRQEEIAQEAIEAGEAPPSTEG